MIVDLILLWAMMAFSLANTILLLWLGLTVLLNAERRTLGVWLVGGGLLIGGVFFVSHSAILGYGLEPSAMGLDFWWQLGWLPLVAAPFVWYALMLWYAGFWDDVHTHLHRRQRPWFVLASLLAVGHVALLLFASPLPSVGQVLGLSIAATPAVAGVPLLLLSFPGYIVLCILLSLDALRRPGPSGRLMGHLARQRARPWLAGAAFALLVVSVLVAGATWWLVYAVRRPGGSGINWLAMVVAGFDLLVEVAISVAILMLGQAIVSYEVFTGKSLPRGGLRRHWRRAIILAGGYGFVMGGSLVLELPAVYHLLLTAVLMTVFYALLSWRSYTDRERYMDHLRPFVTSQRLVEQLLTPAASVAELDVGLLFHVLCNDVLEVQLAYLIPLGRLKPLIGSALTYPRRDMEPPLLIEDLLTQFETPRQMCTALRPTEYGGAAWAVPLWDNLGLVGMLLLGEKRDGGLYTEEEMEIARASGERLMDTLASSEMSRRLMALQRRQLSETQVLDQRPRRLIHDEVLPLLHSAVLALSSGDENLVATVPEAVLLVSEAHHQLSDLLRQMPAAVTPDLTRLGLLPALRKVVDQEWRDAFDEVTWQIEPAAERQLKALSSLPAEVLFGAAREAVRNAARHGRGEADHQSLHLQVTLQSTPGDSGLEVVIEDNGVGAVNSGNELKGQGLALHSTMMAVIGGTLAVESQPNAFTRVRLTLPQAAWTQDN